MAVSVASPIDGRLVPDSLRHDIRRPKTPLGDRRGRNGLQARISGMVGFWEGLRGCKVPREQAAKLASFVGDRPLISAEKGTMRELFRPYRSPEPQLEAPPSYEESIADLPPDYTATDTLAVLDAASRPWEYCPTERKQEKSHTGLLELDLRVDLSKIEGIRSYANKKAKKAAKAAQQAKWADSGDEGEKNEEGGDNAGGDGAGGGDAGGGAGGDGGDPPGGGDGGGNDGDDWFSGFGKKDVSYCESVPGCQVRHD